MIKKINQNNKIFQSEAYLKDRTKFHVIAKNFASPDLLLYSDEETYIVCRGKIGWPTWIWTIDNFPNEKLEELKEVLEFYLTDTEKDKFTCKKELYQQLLKSGFDKLNTEDYFEMGSLYCKNVKKPKDCDGAMSKPLDSEKELLTKYWYEDSIEMEGVDSISLEQARADIEAMFDSGNLFIWRNPDNKIVSMVYYKTIGQEACLNHVYTPKEERGKGYAANLIYSLTKELLNKGLIPLLYTDYNYPASNKAYINAGYEETGILINFSCSKEKLKEISR